MRHWVRTHLTYANVMVTILAFVVLGGGTAFAALVVSSNSQIGPGTVSGHAPPAGKHSNLILGSVNGSDIASNSLGGAKIREATLGPVPNADALGGSPASAFQRRVTGICNGGHGIGIAGVRPDGTASCTSRVVFPIVMTPANGAVPVNRTLGRSPLQVGAACRPTQLFFFNNGPGAATLNWMFSQGTSSNTTVNASGTVIGFHETIPFNYGNSGRLEGQWILASGGGVTTVNLHAFQGQDECEVRGTALWAPL
jgi:hypothetical protein